MAKKLKMSSADMVAQARKQIKEVETAELMASYASDDVVVVDIRDIREREKTGHIPGSVHVPRGMVEFWVDPESPYFREIFNEDKAFVFHCASGWRSALTVETLQNMGFEAAHLKDGFSDWVAQGGAVER